MARLRVSDISDPLWTRYVQRYLTLLIQIRICIFCTSISDDGGSQTLVAATPRKDQIIQPPVSNHVGKQISRHYQNEQNPYSFDAGHDNLSQSIPWVPHCWYKTCHVGKAKNQRELSATRNCQYPQRKSSFATYFFFANDAKMSYILGKGKGCVTAPTFTGR